MGQRTHLVLLTAWTVLWFALVEPHGGFSWHYLRTGGELIYESPESPDGGLNLYAHIALDPGVYTYYTASVLLGTLLWDVIGQRRLVPWWSWIALITLYGSVFTVPDDTARGLVRLGFVVVSTSYVLFWPVRDRRRGRTTSVPRVTVR
ncbi:hypothetical protein [Streptomyces geranii]|uniref:hypothetical protein n=1 Tax=Streptomyces geranii TaxID=2058923 RepID=UPI000D03D158|nr:hypothetical protein [Streptomyces geranii]